MRGFSSAEGRFEGPVSCLQSFVVSLEYRH